MVFISPLIFIFATLSDAQGLLVVLPSGITPEVFILSSSDKNELVHTRQLLYPQYNNLAFSLIFNDCYC